MFPVIQPNSFGMETLNWLAPTSSPQSRPRDAISAPGFASFCYSSCF